MRIVFMGTPDFAVPSLQALIDAGHYGTEKCASHRIATLLSRAFPEIPVFTPDVEHEPCSYVLILNSGVLAVLLSQPRPAV